MSFEKRLEIKSKMCYNKVALFFVRILGGIMKYLICVLIGYLIGSINPSYIISKLCGGDIREKGSGNAGASNALIVYGKLIGVFCALFDIGKAFFAVWLMRSAFSDLPLVFALTAVACILGHVFPFYMRFRGG